VAEAVILNKHDTMSVFDFDEAEFRAVVRSLNYDAPVFAMSATKGDGVEAWTEWLAARIEAARAARGEDDS
jgi:hydrogenase nickel incorporation protein HypB